MALTITVNGAGTFTASMEEGPVSFSASLGAIGPAGPGVAAGGVTGQILVKTTNADYATGWIDNAARTVFVTARNNTGSAIPKGSVVYLSGAAGNKATIALALATSEATSARTIGITKSEIANNADGDVIISGEIANLDTSAFTAGQVVYLSASVAGGLQTTLPTQPNHGVVIGIITRAHPSLGSIEVTVQNYQELKELSDVLITSPTNGQALIYETSSGLWKNLAIPSPDLSAYLTIASAAATYQTQAGMSAYLTTSAASSTYLTQSSASSDYLSKAGNLSGLASTSTARTNLGLGADDSVTFGQLFKGTVAGLQYSINPNDIWAGSYNGVSVTKTSISSSGVTFPDATVQATKGLIPASNLSDLASTSTARTNLGLGTMATETATDYLTKAGNLSDLASTSTARTNLDVYSKSESDALVPAASTTAAGKVELATDAEAATGTDTSRAVTPKALLFTRNSPNIYSPRQDGYTQVVSGGSTVAGPNYVYLNTVSGTSGNYAIRYYQNNLAPLSIGQRLSRIDWSRPIWISCRFAESNFNPLNGNAKARFTFGKITTDVAGDLPRRGFGFTVAGASNFQATGHDGTTLTVGTNGTEAISSNAKDIVVYSDGAGNIKVYANGAEVASCTGGPSSGTNDNPIIQLEVHNVGTNGSNSIVAAANIFYMVP